jgi:hypothetical protein
MLVASKMTGAQAPQFYSYEIVKEYPHDHRAFTQGARALFLYHECCPGVKSGRRCMACLTDVDCDVHLEEVDMALNGVISHPRLPLMMLGCRARVRALVQQFDRRAVTGVPGHPF